MSDLKVPPHSLEVEQSVLGAILIDKNAVVEVAGFLLPEHFYENSHSLIFSAMLSLYEKREPIDLVTISEVLKKKKALEDIGGVAYLSELAAKVPTASHVENYGHIVKDYHTKRELIKQAGKVVEWAFDMASDVKDVLDKTEQSIFSISQAHLTQNFVQLSEALAESFDRLDEIQKKSGSLRGVATGFKDIDNKLAGLQQSNLVVLAARPGMGKTALVLNIAQNVAVKEKQAVGIFSLEMSKEEVVDRLLVAQADIDAWRLKTGKLEEEDFDKLQEAMGVLGDAPIFIDDTPGASVMEMRTKARRLQVEHGLKLLIVDYLQLAYAGKNFENRVQEVSYVSQSLKNLARELKIPVLAVSQLSRAVEARGTKIPQLADLRESGAIEQDADVVMFLYRPEEEEGSEKNVTQYPMKLLVAKHRNGSLGEIDLMFKGDRVRFFGMEKRKAS
ncbi:MAG: replicative DNA helicase [Patescibacteria group bacterium]|nr:replicative DNA helicase [Patescibacteria group bacterium]